MSEEPSIQAAARISVADSVVKGRPAIPDGYISFKGYLDSAKDGIHRLYLDDSFWRWLEVQQADIAHRMEVPTNAQDPRSIVWIKRDARIKRCEVGTAIDIAHAVWGDDDDHKSSVQRKPRPPY